MTIKARLYNSQNINRLFLSPYVEHIIEGDHIIFRNDLFNKVLIAPPHTGNPDKLIARLREGIADDEIIDFLKEIYESADPELVLTAFMQKGIIE
jgi:hypothetical protein